MDEIVLKGMAKWPNVPNVYGWLSLDRRGNWLIKGERIANPAVIAFINRNYQRDEAGRWFFQNGPQRVFATLDYTPIIYRVAGAPESFTIEAHTKLAPAQLEGAWLDENGTALLLTELGIGAVCDRDLAQLLARLADAAGNPADDDLLLETLERRGDAPTRALYLRYGTGKLSVGLLLSAEVPGRFHFVANPRPPEGAPEC